ncbi:MAG: hypothetical protein AAF738_09865 [Bacteroidota bacterium]
MKNKTISVSFPDFIERFPEVELPLTLNDQTHHDFSKHNDPLPSIIIANFIAPIEDVEIDDYTEYIACFKIPKTYDFHAIVYWKAGLLNYTYTLATFSKGGQLIDKRVIAGTFSDGNSIVQSVATIDEDWMIYILSGQNELGNDYDPASSKAMEIELLPDGYISDFENQDA